MNIVHEGTIELGYSVQTLQTGSVEVLTICIMSC